MTTGAHGEHHAGGGWDRLGRAADHFARRVARDARRFAEHVEEHAGDFARDVAREWRRAGSAGEWGDAAADVRRIFEDVRHVLSDVIEGVDELIGRVFHAPGEGEWTRAVSNREATCTGCGRTSAAGTEGWVRRTAGGTEFRCLACGVTGP